MLLSDMGPALCNLSDKESTKISKACQVGRVLSCFKPFCFLGFVLGMFLFVHAAGPTESHQPLVLCGLGWGLFIGVPAKEPVPFYVFYLDPVASIARQTASLRAS